MSKDRNLVIVVDDDLGMLRALKRLLQQHDYEPILFSSGQEFKNHSDIEKAACVILDIDLPDGSGIELRHHLKAIGIFVPVIFITGNAAPHSQSCRRLWMPRVSDQAFFGAGLDRTAQESIGGARVDHHRRRDTGIPGATSEKEAVTALSRWRLFLSSRHGQATIAEGIRHASTLATSHQFGWRHANRRRH